MVLSFSATNGKCDFRCLSLLLLSTLSPFSPPVHALTLAPFFFSPTLLILPVHFHLSIPSPFSYYFSTHVYYFTPFPDNPSIFTPPQLFTSSPLSFHLLTSSPFPSSLAFPFTPSGHDLLSLQVTSLGSPSFISEYKAPHLCVYHSRCATASRQRT